RDPAEPGPAAPPGPAATSPDRAADTPGSARHPRREHAGQVRGECPEPGGQPPVLPNPPTVSWLPPGTIPAPVVSRPLPAPVAGGCPPCYAGAVPGSAVVTVVTGAGNALHTVTQAVTSGSVIPAVTSGLAATTGSVVRAAGTVASGTTSAVNSVASATAATALGTVGSVTAQAGQALAPAVTATVAGAAPVKAAV